MVARQPLKLGLRHAGKLVTVIIEDTCLRVLRGDEELAIKPRRRTPPPSPDSTSGQTPPTPNVNDVPRPNRQAGLETSHRHRGTAGVAFQLELVP